MSVLRRRAAGIVIAAVAASGASVVGALVADGPVLAAPAPRPVLIKAREFAFEPKEVTVRTGETTFEIKNEGALEHNFIIEDSARKTVAQIPVIEAGKTDDLKVNLRAGTYALVCNLPGHKDGGMTGTLRVQP